MRGIRDIGLLLARLGLAFVLIPYGWAKLHDKGFAGTAAGFQQRGIPFPEVSAGVAMAGELGGSILLVLGLLTPLAGLVVAAAMFGAVFTSPGNFFKGGFAHTDQGVVPLFNLHWDGALPFSLGLVALVLAVAGPGRFSLDKAFFGKADWCSPKGAAE